MEYVLIGGVGEFFDHNHITKTRGIRKQCSTISRYHLGIVRF